MYKYIYKNGLINRKARLENELSDVEGKIDEVS